MHEHQDDYPTDATNATLTLDDSIIRRLLAVGHHLVADGLLPSEAEMTVFNGLTADTGRASVFRAGIGLDAPLMRDPASRLADAIGRALRGPRDPDSERRWKLTYLRSQLFQAAHDAAEDLRRDGVEVTAENLRGALEFAVVYARPRSSLIPWEIDNAVVEQMIQVALTDYLALAVAE
jgi:hypothetical protein